jgi:hypothetical protein
MTTFCTIFQKKSKTHGVFFPDGDNTDYWKNVYNSEPQVAQYEIRYADKLQDNTRFMCYYMLNQMHFHMHQRPNTMNYSRIKLDALMYVLDNEFLSPQQKQHIFKAFSKTQNHYFALSRFARAYKYKKALVGIDTDLGLNKINLRKSNTIVIYQNGAKYMFTIQDLLNIIDSCLTNDNVFFADPIPIKNPYNNIPFSAANLYNIYFFVKERNFVMPTLLHLFFLSSFNLQHFIIENEAYLRDASIKKYIQNTPASLLHNKARTLLSTNRYSSRLRICSEFPKNDLVEIMRPYLYLYFISEYSLQTDKRHKYQTYLDDRLKQLYYFNPRFGRKYIEASNHVIKFNTDHPALTFSSIDSHFRRNARASEMFTWHFRPAVRGPQFHPMIQPVFPPARRLRIIVPEPTREPEDGNDSSSDSSSDSNDNNEDHSDSEFVNVNPPHNHARTHSDSEDDSYYSSTEVDSDASSVS